MKLGHGEMLHFYKESLIECFQCRRPQKVGISPFSCIKCGTINHWHPDETITLNSVMEDDFFYVTDYEQKDFE